MSTVSVIGCGHMGSALIKGLAKSGEHHIIASDIDPDAIAAVAEYATETTTDAAEATDSPIVFAALKPDIISMVVADLDLSPDQTLVSTAAGVTTDELKKHTDANVVRIMPNVAAASRNMAAAMTGDDIPAEVIALLEEVGVVVEVDEAKMDVTTAVNGSGPAFVFYLIQAMQEAGIESGLDPEDARVLAAQTFKGAAKIVLDSDEELDSLIDAVCTPGGTTIEGMKILRESDAAAAVTEAVQAAERRSRELASEAEAANE